VVFLDVHNTTPPLKLLPYAPCRYKKCVHRVSKNCAKLFLSESRQISTNFDNFWQKDDKEAKIMQGALVFNLT